MENTGDIPWVIALLDHPKVSKSQPKEMRTASEGCGWAQGQCTAGESEIAAEMHRERDKDTESQSQAEQMQKMRRKKGFVCIHLTQTAPEVLDLKLSLTKVILSGIHRKQRENNLGIIYCIYLGKKKRWV